MATFVPCDRDQAFLLPPDMKEWLPDDDLAHFVIAAAERVSMSVFLVNDRNSGKPQHHPRMMLALLVDAYANGVFSSRRIERAADAPSKHRTGPVKPASVTRLILVRAANAPG